MADITIVNGVYKPTYNWGHHPVEIPQNDFQMGKFWSNLSVAQNVAIFGMGSPKKNRRTGRLARLDKMFRYV